MEGGLNIAGEEQRQQAKREFPNSRQVTSDVYSSFGISSIRANFVKIEYTDGRNASFFRPSIAKSDPLVGTLCRDALILEGVNDLGLDVGNLIIDPVGASTKVRTNDSDVEVLSATELGTVEPD